MNSARATNKGLFEGVTFYHWLVFLIAAAGWLFDCMGQRIFILARRDTRVKAFVPMDGLATHVEGLLKEIQQALFDRARTFREEHTSRTTSYDEFKEIMEGRPGFVISPWCGSADCEAQIKAETQATLRNIPFGGVNVKGTCVKCGQASPSEAWFAKAY